MSLHITLGPMFSGKTSKLMHNYELQILRNKRILVLDYDSQAKYTGFFRGPMKNHDSKTLHECIKTHDLMQYDILGLTSLSDVILINECQFFDDLESYVDYCLENRKEVHVYGLDGDFEKKPMGCVSSIIPKCDTIVKLQGKCSMCPLPSLFSFRTCDSKEKILMDHTKYIPLCRQCYHKMKYQQLYDDM